MMKKLFILLTMLLFVVSNTLMAQSDEPFTASVKVQFKTGDEVTTKPLRYALFKTTKKANEIKAILEATMPEISNGTNPLAFDDAVAKHKLNFKKSKANGTFNVRVLYPGMALLVTSFDPDDDLTSDGADFIVIETVAGQTEYIHVEEKKIDFKGNHTLSNVEVQGQSRDTLSLVVAPALDDGINCYIPIVVHLPAGTVAGDSRLIIQPYAVECETGDSVDFVKGLCYEGAEYHELQDRRMGYNYRKNDKLKDYYSSNIILNLHNRVDIDTTVVYKKRTPSMDYKFPYLVEVADYHHIYFAEWASQSSCTKKNYYKFLNLAVSQADMDLDEFATQADENFETKNQDIKLRFQVGKSVLIQDALNDSIKETFLDELRSYGDLLMQVSIEATASPDGGFEANRKLASGRLDVAYNILRNGLGKADVNFTKQAPRVYSWDDVAKQLDEEGNKDKADSLRAVIPSGEGSIRILPFYDTNIVPILESMRRMRCTYRYERKHIMNGPEVAAFYYEHKQNLIDGKEDLSDGDYYNLFDVIEDPEDQEIITRLAYRHVTKDLGYENVKFAMYCANRMAILKMKEGAPDLEILRPFINTRSSRVQGRPARNTDVAQKNRREILINQILTYYMKDERDSAQSYMNFWFGKASEQNDPKVAKLRMFISFKDRFMKCVTKQMSPSETNSYLQEMEEVLSSHKDNHAVFYTEAALELMTIKQLGLTQHHIDSLVNAMDDNNAKKWYMKGIMAARTEAFKNTKVARPNYIPDYLAYFHHSFKLEPSYKFYYFNDGQVSDDLRKIYLYKKKDYAKYEQRFNDLVVLSGDGKSGENEEDITVSGDDEDDDVVVNLNLDQTANAANPNAGQQPAQDNTDTNTEEED